MKPFGEPITGKRLQRAYAALYTFDSILVTALVIYEISAFGMLVDHGDSPTYIESGFELFSGQPGLWRTPLYSALTTGLELTLGVTVGSAILMILQAAAFLISVAVVGDISRSLMPNHSRAAFTATCIYGLMPWIVMLVVFRLPESLTVSMMVFIVRNLQQWIKNRRPVMAVYVAIWTLLMIAARPIFIYMLPLTGLFFIIGATKRPYRRGAIYGLVLTMLSATGVMAYRTWMERTYGAPVLTVANIVNNYYLLLENRLLTADDITDPDLRTELNSGGDTIHTDLSFKEISRVAIIHTRASYESQNKAIAAHMPEIALITVRRFRDMATGRPWSYVWERFIPDRYNPVCVGWIFVVVAVSVSMLVIRKRRMRPQLALQWIIVAIMTSQIIVVAAGAMFDWGRLTVQIFPLAIISATRTYVTIFSNKKESRHNPTI